MKRVLLISGLVCLASFAVATAQETSASATKPTEHVMGTLTAVDSAAHTVTLKEDGTGASRTIQVGETRTLLKVPPGAKDIKSATRITATDLVVGDRVDVRGFKVESDPTAVAARSVILMSGRDLQQAHQQESAAWQHASTGVIISVNAAGQKFTANIRTPNGPQPASVDASHAQFTRYSPEQPQTPSVSQFSDLQVGDQVRILGDKSADGAIAAQKIYSGSFQTTVGTVVSVAGDGKSMTVKDLQTKQPVNISLGEASVVRKLPPMMAYMLARRFNPDFKGTSAAPAGASTPSAGASTPPANPQPPVSPGGDATGGPGRMRPGANGDLLQMLERVPKIAATELKPGDAVIVSGSPSKDGKTTLLATTVIAGVEPIFQSASPRQAQSLGDWSGLGAGLQGADMGGGAAPPQ